MRNELNHLILECRSSENCEYIRIIRALGFANEHVYAEVPDWLISRLRRVPIQPATFKNSLAKRIMTLPRSRVTSKLHRRALSFGPLTPSLSPSGRGRRVVANAPPTGKRGPEAVLRTRDSPPSFRGPPSPPPRPTGERSAEGRVRGDTINSRRPGVLSLSTSPQRGEVGQGRVRGDNRSTPPPERPSPLPPRPNGERSAEGRVRGRNPSPRGSRARDVDAQRAISSGNTFELAVSVTSVTETSGHNREGRTAVAGFCRGWRRVRQLFRSADGRFCAQVPVGDRLEIYGLRSAAISRLVDRRLS